jgi:hypothetical protein
MQKRGDPKMSEPLVPAQKTNNWAIISLLSGILSFPLACCGFFVFPLASCIALPLGIVAIALGFIARREIKASQGEQTGDGLALAGIILGAIWVVLFVLSCCAIVGLSLTGVAFSDVIETMVATMEPQ